MDKTLLVVDGSSYLFRAYYALPDLRNAAHHPTGAILGVITMLSKVRRDYPCLYGVCVFDAPGRDSFRHTLYQAYKANRRSTPPDLLQQCTPILRIVQQLGWPCIQIPNVEADDVIGTLCTQAYAAGYSCIISSGDKDFAQLVNDKITLVNPMTQDVLDVTGVQKKFGVPPTNMVDYLTLVGDRSDNIPGIEGVGPKTAAKWLTTYGNLEALYLHAEHLSGKAANNVRNNKAWLDTARQLITIQCDTALPHTFTDFLLQAENEEALAQEYTFFGFQQLLQKLSPPTATIAARLDISQHTIESAAQLDAFLLAIQPAGYIFFDMVAHGATVISWSLCLPQGPVTVIPATHTHHLALHRWLSSTKIAKIVHDGKSILHLLDKQQLTIEGIVHDTLLQSYVLQSTASHQLMAQAKRCGLASDLTAPWVDPHNEQHACFRAHILRTIHHHNVAELTKYTRLLFVYESIELPLMRVLFRIEKAGIRIDRDVLQQKSIVLTKQVAQLESQAYALAGEVLNLNSPKQLKTILFEKMGLRPTKKTPAGKASTDEDVLSVFAETNEFAKLVLEHRTLTKVLNTYVDKLPRMADATTQRIHTTFLQTGTSTGRLASLDPNLQNIPIRQHRDIRQAFVARPQAALICVDYSQIELRILAHLCEDPQLCWAFGHGQDIHATTAAQIFHTTVEQVSADQRRFAKTINFGLVYGMSAFGLSKQLHVTREQAQEFMLRYFEKFPTVLAYLETVKVTAREKGYVETLFGRRLWLPDICHKTLSKRQAAERVAINAPMQGSAADLIKMAMICIEQWLENSAPETAMVLQVHDELIFETPLSAARDVAAKIAHIMSHVTELRVPLVVNIGIGSNWDEAH